MAALQAAERRDKETTRAKLRKMEYAERLQTWVDREK